MFDPAARAQLRDLQLRPGDEFYAEVAARGARQPARRWGNRVLLAVNPDPGNPNLYGQRVARSSASVLSIGDLGREYPISVQVRFASLTPGTGTAAPPFVDLNPIIGGFADPPVNVLFRVRRGVDPLAPVTDDVYYLSNVNTLIRCVPFDVISARSLGLEVSIEQPGGTPGQQALCCVWLEAIATVVADVSARARLPGWFESRQRVIAASAASVVLAPEFAGRAQLIIVNTSTNADLWVNFGGLAAAVGGPASLVLPKNQFSRYDGPIGGYTNVVQGIWDNAVPNGAALVTEGTRKSVLIP